MAMLVGVPEETVARTIDNRSRTPLQPLLPRKKKHGRLRTRSAPTALNTNKCVKKRKQWTNANMEAAMKAVTDENRRAAKDHGVPVSTLNDRNFWEGIPW